jgi:hypothetical protein
MSFLDNIDLSFLDDFDVAVFNRELEIDQLERDICEFLRKNNGPYYNPFRG